MSTPITQTPAKPPRFEKRLERVKTEVRTRLNTQPQQRQNGIRAHYWVKWINRNVLEVR